MPASHSPNSAHSHLSPKSYTSGVSPKAAAPNPRLNPFAPLSPDMAENQLELEDGETGDIDRLLGIAVAQSKRRKLLRYSREELLRVALKCQKGGWVIPQGLGSLDTWSPSILKAGLKGQHMDDPAIASMDPSGLGESSRRGMGGQYEQGFGFGGGIGGARGLGRGGKNVGLRRQEGQLDANGLPLPDHRRDAFGGQMGRFSMRAPGEKPMRLGGDEMPPMPQAGQMPRGQDRRGRGEGDWRSKNGPPMRTGERRNHQNWQQVSAEDDAAPAWMDDGPNPEDMAEVMDPAIAGTGSDASMFGFTPGEDMIAAHRRTKGNTDDWRGGGKQLVSFFGGETPSAAVQAKPKSFNAADYLLPSNQEEEVEVEQPALERPNAYTSRFAKFFGAGEGQGGTEFTASTTSLPAPTPSSTGRSPQESVSLNPPQSDGHRVDDRMARLMGLLKTSSPSPGPTPQSDHQTERNHPPPQPPRSVFDQQPQQQSYDRSQYAHDTSQQSAPQSIHLGAGPGPSGPPGLGRGYGAPPPNPLLQQLYQGGRNYEDYPPSTQPPPAPPQSGPDLLRLLTQGQGQGQGRPPMPYPPGTQGPPGPQGPPRPPQSHHSMPPGFGGPMRSQEFREEYHLPPHAQHPSHPSHGQQPFANGQYPPHMYGPPSQGPPKGFPTGPPGPPGPPGYPSGPPGMYPHGMHGGNGHPPPGFRQGTAQQDMLATLAGLGRT